MKKNILITIIVLSVLSIGFGGYVVYDLLLAKDDNKCDAPLEENDMDNDNSSEEDNDDANQNFEDDNDNQSDLNVSKVREKYFDIDNISKIEFGRYAMGPVKYETKVVEDKEIIKSIISEFSFLSFKEFAPYGIGFEGFYFHIIYNDGSVVSIWETGTSKNEIAILDKRKKDHENNTLYNSIIVEFHNGLTFSETFNKYYQ